MAGGQKYKQEHRGGQPSRPEEAADHGDEAEDKGVTN